MQNPEFVLGIACHGRHDSAAALLKNGTCIAAAEESRYTRIKHDRSFPKHAIEACLTYAHISIENIAHAGFFWQPWRGIPTRLMYAARALPHSLSSSSDLSHMTIDLLRTKRMLRARGFRGSFHYVPHHLAHASSVFFSSAFERAAILSLDGAGEIETMWSGRGEDSRLMPMHTSQWPHSLGHLFAAATQYLGFTMFSDEYKVMGLSAYGNPRFIDVFRDWIQVRNGSIVIDLSSISYHQFTEHWYSPQWLTAFGAARMPDGEIEEHHRDVAASVQMRTEEVMTELAENILSETGEKTLCLTGGVALNAVAVGTLAETHPNVQIVTNFVSGDAGCALGSALYVHHTRLGHSEHHPITDAYWGDFYSDAHIEEALKNAGIPYTKILNPEKTAADLIAQGAVIGWFQGRTEYGERALGNRSILADPRDVRVRERVNARIKHRESFRPFAPTILAEHQHEYFTWTKPAPFMTEVHTVRPEMRSRIPAVVHVDGTARLHTIERDTNPLYYDLIAAFHAKTEIPILLNTSFNMSDEPIVNSPDQAIATFVRSGLDALVIGSFLLLGRDLSAQ